MWLSDRQQANQQASSKTVGRKLAKWASGTGGLKRNKCPVDSSVKGRTFHKLKGTTDHRPALFTGIKIDVGSIPL